MRAGGRGMRARIGRVVAALALAAATAGVGVQEAGATMVKLRPAASGTVRVVADRQASRRRALLLRPGGRARAAVRTGTVGQLELRLRRTGVCRPRLRVGVDGRSVLARAVRARRYRRVAVLLPLSAGPPPPRGGAGGGPPPRARPRAPPPPPPPPRPP